MAENINQSFATVGLNKDANINNMQPGQLVDATNAMIETFNGDMVSYTNEFGNTHLVDLPAGFTVVGVRYIPELRYTLYFLTNNVDSIIGYVPDAMSTFVPLIDDRTSGSDKLGLHVQHPIHQVVVKHTNCSTEVYWTDGYNPFRYIDLQNLPWKEQPNPANDYIPTPLVGRLDANKLKVQPNIRIPKISIAGIVNGGILTSGTYQFAAAYSNGLGERYTSVYSVTNPVSIKSTQVGPDFNTAANQAIELVIENLDPTGLYDYFNLYVIKTVNDISTPYRVGTFRINTQTFHYTYTGTGIEEAIDMVEIFEKNDYYDTAQTVTEADGVLVWGVLTGNLVVNYQDIASKVKAYWVSYQIPYGDGEGYEAENTALYKSFMRDEVYPLHIFFYLKNGRQTESFPLVGRAPIPSDRYDEYINDRNTALRTTNCSAEEPRKYWEVYNTATDLGYTPEYIEYKKSIYGDNYMENIDTLEPCYKGPYKYGEFAFWESTDKYDNNPYIYGDLTGKNIRHFKFPDNIISPIHQQSGIGNRAEHVVYPIGIRIDENSLREAIANSNLTAEQKDDIIGYGIVRGHRTANKSIVAKGIFSNIGKYEYKKKTRYYANYPYNDVNADPYFTETKLRPNSGYIPSRSLRGFSSSESKERFLFHSPDTHFRQPSAITGGYLKLETIEAGISYGHFVPVDKNAEYKFLTEETVKAAAGVGVAAVIKIATGTFGWPSVDLADAIPTFTATREMFEKIIPFSNFGYMFTSVGFYGTHYPVPNSSDYKIRTIDFAKYVTEGFNTIDDGKELNHTGRESGLYLKTNAPLLFPHEYVPQAVDFSRYTISSYTNSTIGLEEFYNIFIEKLGANILDTVVGTVLLNYYQERTAAFRYILIMSGSGNDPLLREGINMGDIYKEANTNILLEIVSVDTVYNESTGDYDLHITCAVPFLITNTSVLPVPGLLTIFSSQSDGNVMNSLWYDRLEKENDYPFIVTTQIRSILTAAAEYSYPLETIFEWADHAYEDYQLAYEAFMLGYDAYRRENNTADEEDPEEIREAPISCYYGSIKRYLPGQWGRIGSYELLSTGMYHVQTTPLYKDLSGHKDVFGGDTFITRFALKTKVPLFVDDTFNEHNQADIQYDKLGQYGYPMFWLSTKPENININITNEVNRIIQVMERSPGVGGSGSVLSKIWTGIKGLLSGGIGNMTPVLRLMFRMMKEIWTKIAVPNVNLDQQYPDGIMIRGIMYMYSYGIPYFFVESSINTDLRQAYNTAEGDFYPHTAGEVPDNWLQPINVPIIHDNTYYYNWTYSKDNRENAFPLIRQDFDPNKECYTNFPNRAIYSDKTHLDETKNNWLYYRPLSRKDFPKSFGALTALDGIDNSRVLARFTNKTQIYNALTTIQVSEHVPAELGNPAMFETRPLDLSHNDIGSGGSQHKMLLQTDEGAVYADAIRGEIYIVRGSTLECLSDKGMSKWFNRYLPFEITDYFPTVDVDNNFNGIGLHGVYDLENHRIIITKLDYVPVVEGIQLVDGWFYYKGKKISVTDPVYFCNKSFTISYSFLTQSWISLHTYHPNFYIGKPDHFISNNGNQLWVHGIDRTKYNNFYGTIHPYELEYGISYQVRDEILQFVQDYTIVRKYQDYNQYTVPSEPVFFNKAIVRNGNQCSGYLTLVPQDKTNLAQRFQYPKRLADRTEILVTKSDNLYQYNQIVDLVKDPNTNIILPTCSGLSYQLNQSNLDYGMNSRKKPQIRGKYVQIRHTLDNTSDYQLISNFNLSPTAISYK